MREESSIRFEIPVPWAAAPIRIEATGRHAVAVAGIIATIIILTLTLT